MPKSYKVKSKDTLSEIARNERITERAIIDATKAAAKKGGTAYDRLYVNYNVLIPGMDLIIPDKKQKEKTQSTGTGGAEYRVHLPSKQYLRILIKDPNRIIVGIKLKIEDKEHAIKPIFNFSKDKLVIAINPLPTVSTISSASLELELYSIKGVDHKTVFENIKLNIGDLDPIIDPNTYFNDNGEVTDNIEVKKAVQKMLVNLEYYRIGQQVIGDSSVDIKVDGNFGQFTEAAIASFQKDNNLTVDKQNGFGKLDIDTLRLLVRSQNIPTPEPQGIKIKPTHNDRNLPLFDDDNLHASFDEENGKVLPFQKDSFVNHLMDSLKINYIYH